MRRLACTVHLSFVAPGVMGMGAIVAGIQADLPVGAAIKPLQIEGLLLTLLVALGVSVAWDLLAEPAG